MTSSKPLLSTATVESIAGLSAGSIATLVVHPLDIVKTRMQIYRRTTATSEPLTSWTVLKGLKAQKTPWKAFYRGLTPNLVGNAAGWSSFFFFKAQYERLLASHQTLAHHDENGHSKRLNLAPYEYFAASAFAGATTTMLTNPIWVVKTRMLSSDNTTNGAYRSMGDGARKIWAQEGVHGFYRGVFISLVGVSHGAVQFAVYEPLRKMYLATQPLLPVSPRQRLDNQGILIISTVAKLVAGAVTYPYQVIRARLQNYDSEKRFGRGITGIAGRIWREEGVRGFYYGLGPAVFRVMPATWMTFLVYENVKHQLKEL